MTIKELLAKVAKGEALDEADKSFAGGYDPQKELDAAAGAARRKAEKDASEAREALEKANALIDELKAANDPQKAHDETAKLMARIEKLEAAKKAAEDSAAAMKRTATIRDLAKAAGINAAKGIDPRTIDLLVDNLMANVDIDDADAVKEAFDGFKTANAGLIAANTIGGTGVNTRPGTSTIGGKNPWAKDSFNLTEQMRLMKENPNEAAQLANEVGVKIDFTPTNPLLG